MKVPAWLTKVKREEEASGERPAASAAEDIVVDARSRMTQARLLNGWGLPSHGVRWSAYANRTCAAIDSFTTPVEVIQFAQTKIGFEHRGNIHHEGKFTALYERELAVSFPQFAEQLAGFADIEESAPETTYIHNGRLISNVLFYLTRIVLTCLAYLPTSPKVILEIGGGYGAPARTWMKNPIAKPKTYLILDMPESLFFSDVFLRKEFGKDSVFYVNSDKELTAEILDKYPFILCPLPNFPALQKISVDLVVNTGSMQEMSEEWVDFYKDFMDRQNCRWFYSLNYFSQPVNALWESGNLLSPRLSKNWTARMLRLNPAFVRMQADRDFLEALYEKKESPLSQVDADVLLRQLLQRMPSGESLMELMDFIRRYPNPYAKFQVLEHAMRMHTAPKEALWLCENLRAETLGARERVTVEQWRKDLIGKRAAGTEAYY